MKASLMITLCFRRNQYTYIDMYIYLGRFIRKSAKKKQLKRNKADKNINTRRLCGENNITNKKNKIFNMYSKKVA